MARQYPELDELNQQITALMRANADARVSEYQPLLGFLASHPQTTLFLLVYAAPGSGATVYSLHTRQELRLQSGIPPGCFQKAADRFHVLTKPNRDAGALASRGWL